MINAVLYYDLPAGKSGVTCSGNGDKRFKGFVIAGHAGAAEPERFDLVCAGVSVLAQTALLGLDAYLSSKLAWKIEDDGYMECWLPDNLSPEEMEKAQVIIHTMELGLYSMEESYEQYLKVSKRRWTKCCSK